MVSETSNQGRRRNHLLVQGGVIGEFRSQEHQVCLQSADRHQHRTGRTAQSDHPVLPLQAVLGAAHRAARAEQIRLRPGRVQQRGGVLHGGVHSRPRTRHADSQLLAEDAALAADRPRRTQAQQRDVESRLREAGVRGLRAVALREGASRAEEQGVVLRHVPVLERGDAGPVRPELRGFCRLVLQRHPRHEGDEELLD